MFLGAAAIATFIASRIINLKINTNILTDFAERGYVLKKGPTAEEAKEAKRAFKKSLKDINILSLIPIVNIGYAILHGSNKYANQRIIFTELAANNHIERIDETQSKALEAVSKEKRHKTMMKWQIREMLGLDLLTNKDRKRATGANKAKKVRAARKTPKQKREEELLEKLSKLSPEQREQVEKFLGITSETEEKGKSR